MRNTLKLAAILLIIIAVGIILYSLGSEFIVNYTAAFNMRNLSSIEIPQSGSRVLVFSPHNDDEVLGAGELIRKTVKNGGKVKIVFITNGDGFKTGVEFDYLNLKPNPQDYIDYGYARQKESLKVANALGLKDEDVSFLGYPDGGIAYLWSANWDKTEPYKSPHTQTDKSPYYNSRTKHAIYCGESIVSDISEIISEYKPTHIIYPHPNDRHPDHWATNCFVKYVLASMNYKPDKEWMYLVHRGDWPTPMKRNSNLYLVPPQKLVNTGTDWLALPLDSSDITDKTGLIRLYKTQIQVLGPLLVAFERKNELFGSYGNLKIYQNSRNDTEITPNDNNRVVTDPLQDSISLGITKGADISGIYAEISKSSKLQVFMQFDSNIEKNIDYNLNLVFLGNLKVTRLNIVYRNGKVQLKQLSAQSINSIKGLESKAKGHFLNISIPLDTVGNFDHVFVNSSTSLKHYLLDKSAWRVLDR